MMTQQEADDLIALRKTPEGSQTIVFRPGNNQYLLVSDNGSEKFFLDVYQGTIKLSKMRHQVNVLFADFCQFNHIEEMKNRKPSCEQERSPNTH